MKKFFMYLNVNLLCLSASLCAMEATKQTAVNEVKKEMRAASTGQLPVQVAGPAASSSVVANTGSSIPVTSPEKSAFARDVEEFKKWLTSRQGQAFKLGLLLGLSGAVPPLVGSDYMLLAPVALFASLIWHAKKTKSPNNEDVAAYAGFITSAMLSYYITKTGLGLADRTTWLILIFCLIAGHQVYTKYGKPLPAIPAPTNPSASAKGASAASSTSNSQVTQLVATVSVLPRDRTRQASQAPAAAVSKPAPAVVPAVKAAASPVAASGSSSSPSLSNSGSMSVLLGQKKTS